MKTQISRDPHRPESRYSAVYQQQGRLLTDADWNALSEIVKQRLDDALRDVIGSGAPRGRGVSVVEGHPAEEMGGGGRLYVEGVPARLVAARAAEPFAYDNQADFPEPPPLPTGEACILYADVWERSVDSLEDAGPWTADHLRDPALHGADTTTRTQTMAQVKWCPTFPGPADLEANPRIGDSLLAVTLAADQATSDPCDPCARDVAIDRRVGNYLFRLEVHDVVVIPSTGARFLTLKWSSENGAEHHLVGSEPAGFEVGDHVYEFCNERTDKHLGVHLTTGFAPARGELHGAYPATPPPGFERVRRWDGCAMLRNSPEGAWSLAGVGERSRLSPGRDREVRLQERQLADVAAPGDVGFAGARVLLRLRSLQLSLQVRSFLVAGDYWLAAVRESIHAAGDTVLAEAPPHGILHHYLQLAVAGADGKVQPLGTDRTQQLSFSPLTELAARDVDYFPACPAGLYKGEGAAAIDTVQKALDRLCKLSADDIAFVKPCDSSLFAGVHQKAIPTVAAALKLLCDIEARHVEYVPPGGCTLLEGSKSVEQALHKVCGITAEHVAYQAHPGCAVLDPSIKTVGDALDALCAKPTPVECCVTVGQGGEFHTLDEAVRTLVGLGKRDLCLCLLPGDHYMDQVLELRADGNEGRNLALHGCGGGTSLGITPTGGFNLDGYSLRVESLTIRLNGAAQVVARNGQEVVFEGVHVTGPIPRPVGGVPPVILHAKRSVRVATSRLHFPPTPELPWVEQALTPLHAALGQLFSPAPADGRFQKQREEVARSLISLTPKQREELAAGVAAAIAGPQVVTGRRAVPQRPPTVEPPLLQTSAPVQESLQRFAETIALPTVEMPVVVERLDHLYWVGFGSIPSIALVIEASPGDTTLVDNQIQGVVSVYGAPAPPTLTRAELESLRRGIVGNRPDEPPARIVIVAGAGRLSLARNELSRLIVGGALQQQLHTLAVDPRGTITGLYTAAYLAQNRITAGASRVLAIDVRMTDNLFQPFQADLGAAMANTANYAGNGSLEDDRYLFLSLTRRHNSSTLRDLNTMFIV